MQQPYHFLAFDCGATSGRGVLAVFDGDGFRMEEVCRFPNQTLETGGKYYWNVYSIYEHFLACLTDLAKKGLKINSIGIDTWGVDSAASRRMGACSVCRGRTGILIRPGCRRRFSGFSRGRNSMG